MSDFLLNPKRDRARAEELQKQNAPAKPLPRTQPNPLEANPPSIPGSPSVVEQQRSLNRVGTETDHDASAVQEIRVESLHLTIDFEQLLNDCLGKRFEYLKWADLSARAEREYVQMAAKLTQARSEAVAAYASSDPKLPEWKVKAFVDASTSFEELRRLLGDAERNKHLLRAIVRVLELSLTHHDELAP